ncbi:hypothetical protein SBA4_20049 [Candidatus Sulfopaludibacter sp. SbA4]|nr:hypothetical protein SBA4_20049 [Candidatus Sulfopaludibacter sp. SbA4]
MLTGPRWVSRRFLTLLQNLFLRAKLSAHHTGYLRVQPGGACDGFTPYAALLGRDIINPQVDDVVSFPVARAGCVEAWETAADLLAFRSSSSWKAALSPPQRCGPQSSLSGPKMGI